MSDDTDPYDVAVDALVTTDDLEKNELISTQSCSLEDGVEISTYVNIAGFDSEDSEVARRMAPASIAIMVGEQQIFLPQTNVTRLIDALFRARRKTKQINKELQR